MRPAFRHGLLGLACVAAACSIGVAAQPVPLPESTEFLRKTRERVASNELLQSRYAFKERTREQHLNPFGKMGAGQLVVYEVFPSVDPEMSYRRVLERDGRPVPRQEIDAQDAEYARRYRAWQQRLAGETAGAAAARTRRLAEQDTREREQAAEILGLFDFVIDRRETWKGEPAIVLRFKVKPGARPRSREGRVASVFVGEALIHETEHEVMHVRADTVDDVSFGFGMVARLNKGATTSLTRSRVGSVWLPAQTRFSGDGRALMLRKVTIDYVREYFDYRPYDPTAPPPIAALSSAASR